MNGTESSDSFACVPPVYVTATKSVRAGAAVFAIAVTVTTPCVTLYATLLTLNGEGNAPSDGPAAVARLPAPPVGVMTAPVTTFATGSPSFHDACSAGKS